MKIKKYLVQTIDSLGRDAVWSVEAHSKKEAAEIMLDAAYDDGLDIADIYVGQGRLITVTPNSSSH